MTREQAVEERIREWLHDEASGQLPDWVLATTFERTRAERQRRILSGWRFPSMSITVRIAMAAALSMAAFLGITLSFGQNATAPGASPSPSATPTPTPAPFRGGFGPLSAGTYVVTPFEAPGSDLCWEPPQPGCSETLPDDDIRFTFTVPDGWGGFGPVGVGLAGTGSDGPAGAAIIFVRGAWPYDDPCTGGSVADMIPIGPTAADFADALAEHPLLDVTTPRDITLAGYSGKYVDLQVPNDPTIQGSNDGAGGEGCPIYRPWEPGLFAQGPGERWHLSILDVGGLRVVIQAMDHEGTSAQHQAELQAIVDSIAIVPPTAPAASPSPGSLAWSPASLDQDWPVPVRAEPVGDPVIVPYAGVYTDPSGDIESSDVPWVDIQRLERSVWIDVGDAIPPTPLGGTNEPWIAYGLVFDTDLDGVADVRLGMDGVPAELTPWGDTVRVWRTDLRAGTTEYGDDGGSTVCDCLFPGQFSRRGYISALRPGIPGRFYVWASVIQNGRVVATDYAPDSGWLDSTGSTPGGGDGPTPAASQ